MINMTLSEISSHLAVNSAWQHCNNPASLSFEGISTDSRTLKTGNLYIAIKGEKFDGHEFVDEALKKKAIAVIVNHPVNVTIPQLVVNDTINALGKIASLWRERFSIPLIAVTGSNGKTTLKNMIASILKAECQNNANHVFATEGNFNNHIGMPLTLCKLSSEHQLGVVEMGMNHLGEIEYLTQLAKPTVAVITNAAECHVEGVGDINGVARAKGEIFSGLSNDGIAVLNKDDQFFEYWKSLIGSRHYFSFGINPSADITLALDNSDEKNHYTIITPCGQFDVKLPLPGKHNLMNALAATAAGLAVNIGLETIKLGLENVTSAPGRMNFHHLANNVRIIDDTYNANPFSMRAAIDTLKILDGKKIVVLGDMKELGDKAKEHHFKVGEYAKQAGVDYLFSFGQLSQAISEGFGANAKHFIEPEKLLLTLKPMIEKNVNVLVKGSRSMKMEQFVKALLNERILNNAN